MRPLKRGPNVRAIAKNIGRAGEALLRIVLGDRGGVRRACEFVRTKYLPTAQILTL